MLGLASVLWGLGHLAEAIDLQEQIVQARERVLGSFHRETLQVMNSLGTSLWLNGQYCEALELQERTAANMRQHIGEDDKDTLDALDHLGVTLGSWHSFPESAGNHQNVMAIRMKTRRWNDLKVLET